ncbi:MAG: hypothetical protein HBSAPP02_25410 [Phycisphaerae bacterium]|nr:MAG: hypothetical protein HRU71_13825 [Planctomycetia bacterium]GJQ27509.1 MAG: hypothetical protein HBSAPP02_25410 [Phycisphaerae bacterium]
MRKAFIALSLLFVAGGTAAAKGQPTPAGSPPPFPWEGEVTAANVYVRSGAGSNWYPTTKLNNGDRVVVLGEKFGWYQIAPVPGSFSYVDAAMVDRAAGGKKGTIKQDKVYIRAGSSLESRKNATQIVLNKGDAVEIQGEADGFLKIAPPPGATLFISKQYVRPVDARLRSGMVEKHLSNQPRSLPPENKPAEIPPSPIQPGNAVAAAADSKSAPPQSSGNPPTGDPPIRSADATTSTGTGATEGIKVPMVEGGDAAATSQPGDDESDTKLAAGPNADGAAMAPDAAGNKATSDARTDKKTASAAKTPPKKTDVPAGQPRKTPDRYKAMLTVLESELVAMLAKPLEQQDSEALRKKYEEIANQTEEYVPAEVAKIRVRQLRDRATLKLARKDLYADAEEIAAYRANMDQERMKILRRKVSKAMERFELEGELWRSHAFSPESRRYRLVDPSSKSTVAYVDIPVGVDPNPDHLIGRLVGINTRTQKFSPSARVPIAEAREVIDLSIRKMPPTDELGELPPAGANSNNPAGPGNPLSGRSPAKPAGEPSASAGEADDRLP